MAYSTQVDRKWQKKWEETKIYKFDEDNTENKLYCLEMFSYPSAAKLHVGHWYNFGLTDSWARMKRLQGYNVFHPMGFDAFGLPAENYAIKTGIHPKYSTYSNIRTMEKQLKDMGATYDWDYEVITCDPEYYKWTQWIFLKLFEHGLAYRKKAPVNWCPSCQTVLANGHFQIQYRGCRPLHNQSGGDDDQFGIVLVQSLDAPSHDPLYFILRHVQMRIIGKIGDVDDFFPLEVLRQSLGDVETFESQINDADCVFYHNFTASILAQ